MIDFKCPNCGEELSAENSARGQVFPCPQCGQNLQLPNDYKLPEKKRLTFIEYQRFSRRMRKAIERGVGRASKRMT